MIVPLATIAGLTIVFVSYKRIAPTSVEETSNKELDLYYEMSGKDLRDRRIQLLRAAKVCLNEMISMNDEMKIKSTLHKAGILSDEFMNRASIQLEELTVEKMLIQKEAGLLAQGWENSIFNDAKRVPIEKTSKKNAVEDKLYFKRKEILQKELSERLGISIK